MTDLQTLPGAVSTRTKVIAWSAAALVSLGALAAAGAATASVIADNTSGGVLPDGASWGRTLGAETATIEEGNGSSGLGANLVVSPDGATAYAASWDEVLAFDPQDPATVVRTPIDTVNGLSSIAIAPDGTRAYLAGGSGGDAMGELVVVSVDGQNVSEESRMTLPGVGNMGEYLAVSADGAHLYAADSNTGLWSIDTATGGAELLRSGMALDVVVDPVSGAVFSEIALDDAVHVIRPSDPNGQERILVGSQGNLADAMAVSPDGTLFALAANSTLTLYSTTDLSPVGSIALTGGLSDLAFSPDSTVIAGLRDNSVDVYDVAQQRRLVNIPLQDSYIIGTVVFAAEPGLILARGSAGIAAIETGASRTNWPSYLILVVVCGVLLLGALLAAATVSIWMPRLVSARDASRRENEQRLAAAALASALARDQRAQAEAARLVGIAEQEHAARVQALHQWGDAYREANGGAEPPEGFLPMPVGYAAQAGAPVARTGTNTLAILAIIFGFGGGLLGIVFGHLALAQIRRTGESGRGLAITGLVLGYVGMAALLCWILVVVFVLGSVGSYY